MIPKVLHEHINTASPANVALGGVVQPSGYAQIGSRGRTKVYEDQHLAREARGTGTTNKHLHDGTKVTVFLRKPQLREAGILPKGGVARFYGSAKLHRSGEVYDKVWEKLVQPEKDRDPEKKGYAVLIRVERAE